MTLPLDEYNNLTRSWSGQPDHWFVLTGIHWCEYPDHQMVAELPMPVSVNEMWNNKITLDNQIRAERGEPSTSREIMLPFFKQYEEETKLLSI